MRILTAFALVLCGTCIAGEGARNVPDKGAKQVANRQAAWDTDVLDLFSLEKRDAALQRILKKARYPDKPAYKEDDAGQVKEVVVCPQPKKKPLVTVFARSEHDPEDVSPRSGHFIVIRNDGLILPFYHGANSLDGHFRDLNGDGVIDYIDSWGMGYGDGTVTGLHIVPIREEFVPSLVIFWRERAFQWRLHQPDLERLPTVQIVKTNRLGEVLEIVAEYQWSAAKKQWEGPEGSPKKGFLVVEGDRRETAKKLLKADGKE